MNLSRRAFIAAGLAGFGSMVFNVDHPLAFAQTRANASIHCLLDTTSADAEYVGIYLPTRGINYSKINQSLFSDSRLGDGLSAPASLSDDSVMTRTVIGDDTRTRLTGTNTFPYNATCYIETTWPDGSVTKGTASFASLTMAFTAGHCVFDLDYGGFAKSIRVWPGRNGSYAPYGSANVDSVYIPIEYHRARDNKYDYAALGFIPSNFPSALKTHSYLGARFYTDSNAGGQHIRIDGYPGEKEDPEFWGSMGYIDSDPDNYYHRWRYSIDTTGGMSGTPLATLAGAEEPNRIVGVHVAGTNNPSTNPYNYGIKMDRRMIRFVTSFRVHGEDWGNV